MDCSTPGFPVHHQLPELAQTHVHQVSDAIQPSHPLPSPSPPTFNLSQGQGLFQWVSSSHQVAKVLGFQVQHQSLQWTLVSFRMDWLDLLAVQGTCKSLLQDHVYNFDRYSKYNWLFYTHTSDALTVPISPKSYEYSMLSNFWGLIDEKLIKDRFLKWSCDRIPITTLILRVQFDEFWQNHR